MSRKPKPVVRKPKTVSRKPKVVSRKPKTVSRKIKTVSRKPNQNLINRMKKRRMSTQLSNKNILSFIEKIII